MELICARFRCLQPLHTRMTRAGLNHIFLTRIYDVVDPGLVAKMHKGDHGDTV